ncbi:MAG: bifunctional phosphoribosyl-AMP cyclohydrolase/phosphoribosyl-ATP diphosphatase HisIE [Candidatus Eremiobacteraeota bacterium]|nr:bifunctional phosphoribosyl-AMP cyclohydrolase/phosphoribosyl-ATP diphosphatase HisIE [Candidatus Eremiobacteraeota bacterium]
MQIDELAWSERGLLPVVIVDERSGAVLTLAYADREALRRTIDERTTVLFSRSRGALWKKGETSGHTQTVVGVDYDCDADALLYRVLPNGPACHTGERSCFHRTLAGVPPVGVPPVGAWPADASPGAAFARAVGELARVIAERRRDAPAGSYTASLMNGGIDRIAKKVGEEATEVVIAAKNGDKAEIVWEVADLLYHTFVLLEERGVSLDDVGAELLRRAE